MTDDASDAKAARRAAQPFFNLFMAFLDRTDRVSYWIIVVTLGAMTVLVSTQVFVRYALGSSIDWADECSRLLFVWSMFLAIPHGIRTGIHVGIDLLVKRLNRTLRTGLFRLTAAIGMGLFSLVFVQSTRAGTAVLGEMMPTLEITAAVFYLPVSLAMLHAALHCLPLVLYGEDMIDPLPQESEPA